ncbi:N-acyl homoserine lactonase family protein [uncultured Marivita sp.]|uniref:N-acyl homoserine lactonase family protein n=1 Tax=uncultured Marivita sp. TaxID=888080 RepID=UPI0026233872|nr:N-acyl homoserine lactonase family protein [uncultured Marivita sp.]
MSRRRLFGLGSLGAMAAAMGGCTFLMTRSVKAVDAAPPPPPPPPVSVRVSRGIRLHMIQTGWVAVKREHRAFNGPPALRLPAIMASRNWTEWMPITAFVIEHPEGLIVVDTGETARIADPGYTACDSMTGTFYNRNLQFVVTPEDEIAPQMIRLGLSPGQVRQVVMTHLHSDHMGGMSSFPNARVFVSDAARQGHAGALMCRLPSGVAYAPVTYAERNVGVFANTMALTADGTVYLVPTPGHARGHQSVLIVDEGKSLCLVGDAAFSLDQIQSGEIGGIVENHADAVRSVGILKRQFDAFGTIMLPTHDPGNASRLGGA